MFLHSANIYYTAQQTSVLMSPMYEPTLMFYPQPLKGSLMFYYLTCSFMFLFYVTSFCATIIVCCVALLYVLYFYLPFFSTSKYFSSPTCPPLKFTSSPSISLFFEYALHNG